MRNIEKLHTTELGKMRIEKNLNLKEDAACYCKQMIKNNKSDIYKQGKNWYCEIDNIRITIHSHSDTIITAHIVKSTHEELSKTNTYYQSLHLKSIQNNEYTIW